MPILHVIGNNYPDFTSVSRVPLFTAQIWRGGANRSMRTFVGVQMLHKPRESVLEGVTFRWVATVSRPCEPPSTTLVWLWGNLGDFGGENLPFCASRRHALRLCGDRHGQPLFHSTTPAAALRACSGIFLRAFRLRAMRSL